MAAREASSTNWIKETKGKKRKGVRKRNGDHSEMIEKSLVLASHCGIWTLLQVHSPSFHAKWNLSTIRSCTRLYVFSLQPTFWLTAFVWIFALVHCSSYTVTWSTQSSDTVRVLLHSVFGSRQRINVRSSLSSATRTNRLLICSRSFNSISVWQPHSGMYQAALSASQWTGEPVEPLIILVSFTLPWDTDICVQ